MKEFSHNKDYGLLVMRVIVGAIFMVHGYMKFTGAPGGIAFFDSIHLGSFWFYLVATVELVGGLSLIVGFGSKAAAMLLAIISIVAAIKTGAAGKGISGYEYLFVLFGTTFGLSLIGPGRYSIGPSCGCPVGKCTSEKH